MKQFKNLWEKFVEGEKFRDAPRSLKDIMENLPETTMSFFVVAKREKTENDTQVNEFNVYEIYNSELVFRIKKIDWKLLEKNGVSVNGFKLSSDALVLNNLTPIADYEFSEILSRSWVNIPSIPGAANNEKRFYYVYDIDILNKREDLGLGRLCFNVQPKEEKGNE